MVAVARPKWEITVIDVLAFILEVTAVVIPRVGGLRPSAITTMRACPGMGTPTAAITLWWIYAAPRSHCSLAVAEVAIRVVVLADSRRAQAASSAELGTH